MKKNLWFLASLVCVVAFPVGRASAANGRGVNYCIKVTNTAPTWGDSGDTVFTNTCNQSVVLIVANQKAIWDPALIPPGGNNTHSTANGPFRYFTCTQGSEPVDSTGNWATYNTADYYCH
jgi:hypothetical protein